MKKWVIEIICLLFVVLFGYAAISKLVDYQQFITQLQESPLKRFANTIAWLTPTSEIVLAVLLLLPKTRRLALYGSFLLMMGFTVYIIYLLKFSPDVPCSCGGLLETMNWTQHLVFNIVFTLLSLIGIVLLRRSRESDQLLQFRTKLLYGTMSAIVLALIVGAVSVSAIGLHTPPPIKPGAPMPNFSFQLMDGKSSMSTSDIPDGKPVVLVYFSPTCGHCQDELIELTQKKEAIKDMRFYFISSSDFKKVKVLHDTLQLSRFDNITLGVDTARYFYKSFKPTGTPYQVIYNKEKKLHFIIPGESSVETLVGVANNNNKS
ncbi:AhpC/TSA family protein [Filimonas lacunae]|uniref:AhpC/TSA family protein n=1 Tax=Filimonas lacunae TaxID=477680 RepID=A0A173MJQ8_9BACT|nr:MauE/DoxX family redox-associated membrane protein [Filimonas lacunae]BAV07696.1 hypothetical protein FLA_3727 [Filimonas lacunae]SIT03641.1 AhpC/TSA family protein [Filimonas lacunae]